MSPLKAKLIPFRRQPPQEVEVLYVQWHTSPGQMPAKHLYNTPGMADHVWAWVPDKRMRKSRATKACHAAHERWGVNSYYRPPRGGKSTPVRIFGGKKWTWYWLYRETPPKSHGID